MNEDGWDIMMKNAVQLNLSEIKLEESFREEEEVDLALARDIEEKGLKESLLVEKKSNHEYILVEGYRRYYALKSRGIETAVCNVDQLTSEEERLIKRLRVEIHTKKRSAYELEKMIKRLLEIKDYDSSQLAKLLNIGEKTIKKYLRGLNVPPEWVKKGEKSGVGRHTLTDIHELDFDNEIKEHLVKGFIDREIKKSTIDAIKKVSKTMKQFIMSIENLEKFIEEFEAENSGEEEINNVIIHKLNLQNGFDENSHTIIHNNVINLIIGIEDIFYNSHYINNLSSSQKETLKDRLSLLLKIIDD